MAVQVFRQLQGVPGPCGNGSIWNSSSNSSRCYNVQLSLNSENRLDNLQSWKVGSETIRESTPEIAPPANSSGSSGAVYFQLRDGVEKAWFVQVDYNEYYAMYGCKNGEEPVFLIATKAQERNESRLNEIAESVAKVVALPEGKHWTDITYC
nr:unnamed protein product [Callosobruchus analis]